MSGIASPDGGNRDQFDPNPAAGGDCHRHRAGARSPAAKIAGLSSVPLSPALNDMTLTRPCPKCGHNLEKKGIWFKVIKSYRCEACDEDIPMDYETKLRLFDAHAHLISEN